MITLPHCETNITLACQLRCVGCNHFVALQKGEAIKPRRFEYDLTEFGRVAHVEKYAIIGGEPLLHKEIDQLVTILRQSFISDWVELWTNGIAFKKASDRLLNSIHELVLSRYPGKLTDSEVEYMRLKCEDFGVRFTLRDGPAYFTQVAYAEEADSAQAAARYAQCWYKTYTHVLDNGYFYRCCTSPFIPALLLGLPKQTDGIPVEGLSERRLREFLEQEETPESCKRCAAHNGPHISWKEERKPDEWLRESIYGV